jgi:hypothetical protein
VGNSVGHHRGLLRAALLTPCGQLHLDRGVG